MTTLELARPVLREAKDGVKLNDLLKSGIYHKILIPFWHGIGDVVMFLPILASLRRHNPDLTIELGLCKGLGQEAFVPDAVLLDGDWREKALTLGYDLIFPCNFPLEKIEDTSRTKAEICCEEEIGISPISGHPVIHAKRLVGVHFQMTSIPWVANAEKDVAEKIWRDIEDAGFVPMETHFEHVFHNPVNERYSFVDTHVRACAPKVDTLMALLRSCFAFVGVVSGNFHLALAVKGPARVMLLERDLKAAHFTKDNIAAANLKDYRGEVKAWLNTL